MDHRIRLLAVALTVLALAGPASAECPDCPVKGGGSPKTDCHVELASDILRVNYPAAPMKSKEIRCFDGDSCDLDGQVNNSCTFDVDVCLHNADPSLPDCAVATVTAATVDGVDDYPQLASLQSAIDALLPASTNVCTASETVVMPLVGPDEDGVYEPAKLSYKVATEGGKDKDKYKFQCIPRGWPSHGFDNQNTRSTPLASGITTANVDTLVEKWRFDVPGNGQVVSSTVTVGQTMVYVSGWDSKVYALDKRTGAIKWSFHTHATPLGTVKGIQSSVTLTPDGRVIVGDSEGQVFCLDGKKGKILWQADAASEDPVNAHAWASPTVANGRVFMGIASHNDAPCVRGTMVAFDLDTGAELWRQYSVPERVCYADTTDECSSNAECAAGGSPCLIGECDSNPNITCSTNGDCPATFINPGRCVAAGQPTGECWLERSVSCTVDADCPACIPGKGGGITATPSTSQDGKSLYMASVGCLSYPSIGNSDAMLKLDAATGEIDWAYRTESIEQFTTFPGGPTYHDYGFLNGPILVDNGTPLAVAGGKDGTVYAVNQNDGSLEWSNQLAVAPSFAGFGLFNGALAYDAPTDQFFAALYAIPTYATANDHLYAFSGADGTTQWSELPGAINESWSSVTVADGILYAGFVNFSRLDAFDVTSGALLQTLPVPDGQVMGGPAIENGVIYIPWGQLTNGPGGVIAYELPAP